MCVYIYTPNLEIYGQRDDEKDKSEAIGKLGRLR